MSLKTDHSFHIGEQHLKTGKPCQDYALSGLISEDIAYAIVSDGCSSGGMTDIGARLMVMATKRALEECVTDPNFPENEEQMIKVNDLRNSYLEFYRDSLGLEYKDLLATCLWAIVTTDRAFVHITGDGAVALQYEEDTVIHHFSWDKNMPYYPAYKIGGMDDSYKEAQRDSKTPLTYIEEGLAPTGMGGIPDGCLSEHSVEEGMSGQIIFGTHSEEDYSPGKLLSVALFSDGVEQIDNSPYQDVVKGLMSFKSTNGQFAVRRMNRFLQEAKKSGRGPIDDIAYAVVNLGSEKQ